MPGATDTTGTLQALLAQEQQGAAGGSPLVSALSGMAPLASGIAAASDPYGRMVKPTVGVQQGQERRKQAKGEQGKDRQAMLARAIAQNQMAQARQQMAAAKFNNELMGQVANTKLTQIYFGMRSAFPGKAGEFDLMAAVGMMEPELRQHLDPDTLFKMSSELKAEQSQEIKLENLEYTKKRFEQTLKNFRETKRHRAVTEGQAAQGLGLKRDARTRADRYLEMAEEKREEAVEAHDWKKAEAARKKEQEYRTKAEHEMRKESHEWVGEGAARARRKEPRDVAADARAAESHEWGRALHEGRGVLYQYLKADGKTKDYVFGATKKEAFTNYKELVNKGLAIGAGKTVAFELHDNSAKLRLAKDIVDESRDFLNKFHKGDASSQQLKDFEAQLPFTNRAYEYYFRTFPGATTYPQVGIKEGNIFTSDKPIVKLQQGIPQGVTPSPDLVKKLKAAGSGKVAIDDNGLIWKIVNGMPQVVGRE